MSIACSFFDRHGNALQATDDEGEGTEDGKVEVGQIYFEVETLYDELDIILIPHNFIL